MPGADGRRGAWEARDGITRRALIAAGAVAGAGLAFGVPSASGSFGRVVGGTDFSRLPDGSGWPSGWACPGVANLRVSGGAGVLEAGSDVFPYDPRPVAFAVDRRFVTGSVRAAVEAAGSLVGVVVRRTSPRDYYAAFYDAEDGILSIVRRSATELVTLASTAAPALTATFSLELAAVGVSPTALAAVLSDASGLALHTTAEDGHDPLQQAGDAGVLGQARTLFPSAGPAVLPGLGNAHLLPYGVQQGQAFIGSPLGRPVIEEIKRQSTVAFRAITILSGETPRPTPASVIAATTTVPLPSGARLRVASDLPAEITLEVSETPTFERAQRLHPGRTSAYDAYHVDARGLTPRRRAYWRATLHRNGATTVGPVRSFPMLPPGGDAGRAQVAIASCACQFGPIFNSLLELAPDVFVWMGDLNYPDTVGPLAQTMTGYAGVWRDFLANPLLAPLFERSLFVPMRDDHDYGANDSNSTVIPRLPWGVAPWDALMGKQIGVSFSAGLADFWVLDQRRFKSDPTLPDRLPKTLIGERQREWLLTGLKASTAPFKVICSPCTVFMSANRADGNWSDGFTAERDAILRYIDREVSGRVIFVAGDFHLTGVYDREGRYEARPCPLDIPVPNDVTLDDPNYAEHLRARPGVSYADNRGHFGVVEVYGDGDTAVLELSLRRDDGTTPYRKTFTQPIPLPAMSVSLGPVSGRSARVTIRLDRPGPVQVSAVLTRTWMGRRRTTPVAARVVRFQGAGTRRVILRFPRASRAALGQPGRLQLTVTARYRSSSGKVVVREVRRLLRR